MGYRLPSERVALALDGPTVEVERLGAWAIYWRAMNLLSAYYAAKKPADVAAALEGLVSFVVPEAQPTWDITDHRGPVPTSPSGMLRLPVVLILEISTGWLETFAKAEPATAVDKMVPPGALRDELNAALRKAA